MASQTRTPAGFPAFSPLARAIVRLEALNDFGGTWSQARRELSNALARWRPDGSGGGHWEYRMPSHRTTSNFDAALCAQARYLVIGRDGVMWQFPEDPPTAPTNSGTL